MEKQNYQNHKRYYAPHHFIFLPLMFILLIIGIYEAYNCPDKKLEWSLFSVLSFCILYLAIMLRQHYALGNQDRIVRLEFRLRYFELSGKSAGPIESRLTFPQIAALRFANDEEFSVLLTKALQENLAGDKIKQAIKDWQPDSMRL